MSFLGRLTRLLSGRPQPESPPEVPGFSNAQVQLPTTDADESVAPNTADNAERALSTLLVIRYCDAKGNFSRRRITLRRITPREGDLMMAAYCHERRAPRHFLASRVVECIDASTGEVFNDVRAYLANHVLFDADIGAQRERGTRTALRRHRTDLAALIYLARSDGHLHEGEADLVVEYIERIAEEPVDRTLIFRHLARLYPDWESCNDALHDIADRSPEQLQCFVDVVGRMLDVDGRVSEEEVEFLHDLQTVFSDHEIGMVIDGRQ